MEISTIIETAANVAALILLASIGLAVIRLILGPNLADRVVALDLITMLAIAFAGVAAISSAHPALLDVGLSLALVAFLATLAFAWYIERRTECLEAEAADDPAEEEV